MIRKIVLSNFKKFETLKFELLNRVVVVGPNNCGKTSLLQAITMWSELGNVWLQSYGDSPIRGQDGKYGSVEYELASFSSVELSRFDELWRNRATQNPISIRATSEQWDVGFDVIYKEPSLISISPMNEISEADLESYADDTFSALYIQSLSGLDAKEPLYGGGLIDSRLARGKGGTVLRNLFHTVSQDSEHWDQLQSDIGSFFGYELSVPSGEDPILANYRHSSSQNWFNMVSGASGFLQAVLILSALRYETPSIILVDEPDAHLHTLLQEKIYRHLRQHCESRNCQLIVASHSNVLIDEARREGVDTLQILTEDGLNRIGSTDAHELMKLQTDDIVNAQIQKSILYLEGKSDLDILRVWANVLNHQALGFLEQVFFKFTAEIENKRKNPAKHFSALKSLVPDLTAIDVRDRNKKGQIKSSGNQPGSLTVSEKKSIPKGLKQVTWTRYEIENYLLHPKAIERFVDEQTGVEGKRLCRKYMKQNLPPELHDNPFNQTIVDKTGGKGTIGEILNASGINIKESEYYKVAMAMKPDEIHPDIIEVLDLIHNHLIR